ncbi:hypothetical protein DPSP01_009275 [Paraphaeosphaeria sporulosa]
MPAHLTAPVCLFRLQCTERLPTSAPRGRANNTSTLAGKLTYMTSHTENTETLTSTTVKAGASSEQDPFSAFSHRPTSRVTNLLVQGPSTESSKDAPSSEPLQNQRTLKSSPILQTLASLAMPLVLFRIHGHSLHLKSKFQGRNSADDF